MVPLEIIQQLKETFAEDKPTNIEHPVKIGDRVLIDSGSMSGIEGIVCRVLPGKRRIAVLLEFLGQQTQIEIDIDQVQLPRDYRAAIT
jgi:transcription antitermination factor NusG